MAVQDGFQFPTPNPYNTGVSWSGNSIDIVSEATDPSIVVVSTPTTTNGPVVLSIGDESALRLYQLTCKDRTDGKRLVIYSVADSGFVHPFTGRSTVSGVGTLANPYIFTVYRRGRWPTGIDLDIKAQAVDANGNEVTLSCTLRLAT